MYSLSKADVISAGTADVALLMYYVCMRLAKSEAKQEKFDWKPLYLDAQATTPMVGN